MTIAMPGKPIVHQAVALKVLSSVIIAPHSGAGGPALSPKQLRLAARTIGSTTWARAKTVAAVITFCLSEHDVGLRPCRRIDARNGAHHSQESMT
jgi:hypothetical protein